jgi:hypothetical protein
MIRFIVPTIAAAALLSTPAAACDPEDLLREYRAMCVEPVELAETMFKASALANDAKASAEFVRRADEAKNCAPRTSMGRLSRSRLSSGAISAAPSRRAA